jgi:predicted Zn-dependent protease
MKPKIKAVSISTLALLSLIAGCSGSGGGGGTFPGISGLPLGSIIGDQNAKYVDAAATALSAEAMTVEKQDEFGKAVAIAATNRWPLFDKPELTKYVTMVGITVASESSNPTGNWVFGVLDTPDINAFSGPNGYIMVTRGAIAAMEDESELAGVLAHEIAHVDNRDGLESIKNEKRNEALMKGLSTTNQNFAFFNQLTGNLTQKILTSGYSQAQETNADSKGQKLLVAAGYDPNGLVKFLRHLEERKGGSGKLFSTHPGTADRIARITSQIGSAKPGATNRERFVKETAAAKY